MRFAVGDNATAGEEARARSIRTQFSATNGDRPGSVPATIYPSDGTAIVPSIHALNLRDEVHGFMCRVTTEGRCRAEQVDESKRSERWLDERTFECGAEMLDIGDSDDGWLWLPVEIRTMGKQGVVHHVDDDTVFDLVFDACDQLCCKACISCRVPGAWRSAGEWMAADDATLSFDEQFG